MLISKFQPTIIPNKDVFGIDDVIERGELIYTLKEFGVGRVNIQYPKSGAVDRDKDIVEKSVVMAGDFADNGILVSMCGIDDVKKLKKIQQIGGRETIDKIAFFNCAKNNKAVEDYCRRNEIPYVPSVEYRNEFDGRLHKGETLLKAYPFYNGETAGAHNFIGEFDVQKRMGYEDRECQIIASGGIEPIDSETGKITRKFKTVMGMHTVVAVGSTQPVEMFLQKERVNVRLTDLENYIKTIAD